MMKYFNWTPLHVAASRGHQELFQTLLNRNPELAEALDSQQRSLLHLASANGHLEIVKALIEVRPEMCLARDRDGANPPHVAAMRGKVDVLNELFQANPLAARARVDSGERETILHICVKYNQLQFLQKLLDKYFKGEEFVNAKDNAGNTILHLAVAGRRFEIIKHVLHYTEIDVNATNTSKQTALDILSLGQENGTRPKKVFRHTEIDVNATNVSKQTEMDILCLGQEKGTKPEKVDKDIKAFLQNYHAERADNAAEVGEEKNQIIVAAVLLATLAFQAGVAPPGGVWPDDSDGHKSGKSVMASNHPLLYVFFLWFNTSGFISSLCTLIFIMTDWPFEPRTYLLWKSVTKIITIASIAVAYFISIFMVSPIQKHDRRTLQSRFGHIEGIIVLVFAAYFVLVLITITATNKRIRSHIGGFIKIIKRWIG